MMDYEPAAAVVPKKSETPCEADPFYEEMNRWADERIRALEPYWKRCKHNRELVLGLNWKKSPEDKDFVRLRANLIHSTINVLLPKVYARDPEASVTQRGKRQDKALLCKTLEEVLAKAMEDAQLKGKFKRAVRSALTCSIGAIKAVWQQEYKKDPIIADRIADTQDNIARIDQLLAQMSNEDSAKSEQELAKRQLEETLAGLEQQTEVLVAEGLALDAIPPEQILWDQEVRDFWDYPVSRRIAQLIPMRRCDAESLFNMEFSRARKVAQEKTPESKEQGGKIFFGTQQATKTSAEEQVWIVELWDKDAMQVYTWALDCEYAARAPYTPSALGKRWYPFFLVPFQTVDGSVVGPSLVDLTQKLQEEHNEARDAFNEHRKLVKPGYIADRDTKPSDLTRFTSAVIGEVTLVDANGRPLNQVIVPKQHPPFDLAPYSTDAVRQDWEIVTGQQDAARGVVVKPKTATEASILEQSMSARVSEFSDQIEDILSELFSYSAELYLQQYTAEQVQRLTGLTAEEIDWPQAQNPEEAFQLLDVRIRAGSNTAPDRLGDQENWTKLLAIIMPMVTNITSLIAQGQQGVAQPLIELLKETLARFDDRLDPNRFLPPMPVAAQMPIPGMPSMHPQAGEVALPGQAIPAQAQAIHL